MSDDQEFVTDDTGQEAGTARSLRPSAHLDDALGLIDACRRVDGIGSEYDSKLRVCGLLDTFKIATDSADETRLIEDASVVAAAFHVASDLINKDAAQRPLTNASVCKILETVIDQAEKVEAAEQKIDEAMNDIAGPYARLVLEETALNMALRPLLPVSGKLPAFRRFAQRADRVKMLVNPISRAMLARRSLGALGRVRRNSPQPDSLVESVVAAHHEMLPDDVEKMMGEIAAGIPGQLWSKSTRRHLLETARVALESLRNSAAPSVDIGPQANLVLTIGALELFCAWQPDQRPITTDGKTVALVIENLRKVCPTKKIRKGVPPPKKEDGDTPRKSLLEVVSAWKMGRSAVLFDGRDPTRERRRRCIRDFQLAGR